MTLFVVILAFMSLAKGYRTVSGNGKFVAILEIDISLWGRFSRTSGRQMLYFRRGASGIARMPDWPVRPWPYALTEETNQREAGIGI